MPDADQIGVAVTQPCAQFVIIQLWMDTGAVVALRGGMHTQEAFILTAIVTWRERGAATRCRAVLPSRSPGAFPVADAAP